LCKEEEIKCEGYREINSEMHGIGKERNRNLKRKRQKNRQ
jgi:hypothetical protein